MTSDSIPPIEGLGNAPEFFIEGYQGASIRNGVIHINTFVNRIDPVSQKSFRAAGPVLAISLADFANIAAAFQRLVAELLEKGILIATAKPASAADKAQGTA